MCMILDHRGNDGNFMPSLHWAEIKNFYFPLSKGMLEGLRDNAALMTHVLGANALRRGFWWQEDHTVDYPHCRYMGVDYLSCFWWIYACLVSDEGRCIGKGKSSCVGTKHSHHPKSRWHWIMEIQHERPKHKSNSDSKATSRNLTALLIYIIPSHFSALQEISFTRCFQEGWHCTLMSDLGSVICWN